MAAVAVGVFAMANGAFAAAPEVSVTVSAAVTQKCVVASAGVLDITIDPAATGAQTFTTITQPSAQCTKTKASANAAITATSSNAGSSASGTLVGNLVAAGATNIPYTFTFNPTVVGNGFGSAADVDFSISGSIAEADAQVAEYNLAGYTDTVTLTLAY